MIVLFTGMSGAGKTTLAKALEVELREHGYYVKRLDGDTMREDPLCSGLGFSKEDRIENIRRLGMRARSLIDAGVEIVLIAAIAPYAESRSDLRVHPRYPFCEIFVDCPMDVLIERDPKGLYKLALAGQLKHFTGVSDPYEEPEAPDLHLRTDRDHVTPCVRECSEYIRARVLKAGPGAPEAVVTTNGLQPAQTEVLALLAEECGEVIQVVGKILRNGLNGRHPDGGPNNRTLLTRELGDVWAAMRLCRQYGAVGAVAEVTEAADKKLARIDEFLHHAKVER